MVAQHPVRPAALGQGRFVVVDHLRDVRARSTARQQREVERQVRAAQVAAVVGHEPLEGQVDLADQQAVVEFVDHTRASPR